MLITGTERVEIAHEPGEWMELKRLNAKKLKKAREAKTQEAWLMMQAAGPEFMTQIRSVATDTRSARNADPLDDFDAWKLCEYGIAYWSYPEDVTVANIEEFDERTLNWAAREILRVSGVESQPEVAQKNGFEPSIVS